MNRISLPVLFFAPGGREAIHLCPAHCRFFCVRGCWSSRDIWTILPGLSGYMRRNTWFIQDCRRSKVLCRLNESGITSEFKNYCVIARESRARFIRQRSVSDYILASGWRKYGWKQSPPRDPGGGEFTSLRLYIEANSMREHSWYEAQA